MPIWLDLIASPSEWAASFLSPEAKEVLEVLGGVVVVFSLPASPSSGDGARDLIRNIGRVVREGLGGWEWDGVSLCVGVGEIDDVDEWEDCCAEWGLEFVQVRGQHQSAGASDRNEFGGAYTLPLCVLFPSLPFVLEGAHYRVSFHSYISRYRLRNS